MTAVNANPALESQVAPPGNQTSAAPSLEKHLLELQRRERELTKREASLKDSVSWDQIKEMATKDRKSFFEKIGIEDFAPAETVDPIQKEIRELKAQLEAEKKQKQDEEFRGSVKSQLRENADKYELLQLLGDEDEIFDHYGKAMKEDGTPYQPLEIADQIEQHLYSKVQSASSSKKLQELFKTLLAPKPNEQQASQPKPQTSHPLDSRATLSSQDRGASTGDGSQRVLSRAESLAAAAAHLKYTKPQD